VLPVVPRERDAVHQRQRLHHNRHRGRVLLHGHQEVVQPGDEERAQVRHDQLGRRLPASALQDRRHSAVRGPGHCLAASARRRPRFSQVLAAASAHRGRGGVSDRALLLHCV